MDKKNFILYMRNFIFGAEDSLVSTVGLLSGIVSAGIIQKEVITSGLILIFVESFSMSVGSFLSERTTEEHYHDFKRAESRTIPAAFIMFLSYLFFGLIPLFPYIIIDKQAFLLSILASLFTLFLLGFISAKILKTKLLKTAIRMVTIGGLAICIGVIMGAIIK